MTTPFPLVERAVVELLETKIPALNGRVDGKLAYEPEQGIYVYIGLIPGGGRTDEVEGQWSLDLDVFAPHYVTAMKMALDIEAAIVGPRHATSTMVIDQCLQNEAPSPSPWNDDRASRVGAIYVFTARRSG